MLKRFGFWAGFIAVSGVLSVEPVVAAEAVKDAGSNRPPISHASKPTPADTQHSAGHAADGATDTVARRPPSVRPAEIVPAHSGKTTHLARAHSTTKPVNAEKRPRPAAKMAALSAAGSRPKEVGSTSAFRTDEVSALPSAPSPKQPLPLAFVPTNSSMPPGDAYIHARSLEGENQTANAIPLYAEASRQGHSAASLRLMEIYAMGAEGVSKNYIAAVEFKRLAVQQGARLEYPPHR